MSAGRVGGVSTPGATCGRSSRELSPVAPVGRPGELTHGFVQIRAADGELPLLCQAYDLGTASGQLQMIEAVFRTLRWLVCVSFRKR